MPQVNPPGSPTSGIPGNLGNPGNLPDTTPQAFASYLDANFAGTDGVKGHPLHALDALGYAGSTLGDQWLKFWAAEQAKFGSKYPLLTAEQAFIVLWEEGATGSNIAAGAAGGLAAAGATTLSGAQTAETIFSVLQSPNLWIRAGEVVLGLVLLAVGIARLTNAVPIATKVASYVR